MGESHNTGMGPQAVATVGRLIAAAGTIRVGVGVIALASVRSKLVSERITIPETARWMPGRPVRGALSAYAEAEAINQIAKSSTRGRTYGEMNEDDPLAHIAMEASLLRASLFTSVLGFALAASEVVAGVTMIVLGRALASLGLHQRGDCT